MHNERLWSASGVYLGCICSAVHLKRICNAVHAVRCICSASVVLLKVLCIWIASGAHLQCICISFLDPPECDEPHKEFRECGPMCPLTCNFSGQPDNCFQRCVRGCYCNEGYVLDYSNRCVLPDECPKGQFLHFLYSFWKYKIFTELKEFKCGFGEDYTFCGLNCADPTCYNEVEEYPIPECPLSCNSTKNCICKNGFRRSGFQIPGYGSVCIPKHMCGYGKCFWLNFGLLKNCLISDADNLKKYLDGLSEKQTI